MKNADKPINPLQYGGYPSSEDAMYGLTKREYFAGLAMQGILANGFYDYKFSESGCIESSVYMADKLMEALEQNDKP